MKAENKWYYMFRGERKATYILLLLIALAVTFRIWYVNSNRQCNTPNEAECKAAIEMLKRSKDESYATNDSINSQKKVSKKHKTKQKAQNHTTTDIDGLEVVPQQ